MAENKSQKTDVVAQLRANREFYVGNPAMGCIMLLTFPRYIDSARGIMFASHINQAKIPLYANFPLVFTNFENTVGENSSYNVKAKHDYKVIDIISKFPDIQTDECNAVQEKLIFIYDKETKSYGVITRTNVEDFTEKYGLQYNTSGIDKFDVGSNIPKGTPLMHPTSFDENGNYGFGQNVRFMYDIDNDTHEDAICVSRSLANAFTSVEVELVTVSLNDNEFLLNLYGDDDNYKTFPDVGEKVVSKRLCTKRRINNSQLLFDFKKSNTNVILPSDTSTYVEGEIVDVIMWSNKPYDEIPKTIFNKQVLEYLDMNNRYFTRIKEVTDRLIDSGIPCSEDIKYLHKQAIQITSGDYKIKDNSNSVFSNIQIQFVVKRVTGLAKGQKLTGRYGNKGVISSIREDYEMPRIRTGEHTTERVDIIFNTLGVYNRLNIAQLYEQSITFITQQVTQRLRQMDFQKDREAMEKIYFTAIEVFNKEQADRFRVIYNEQCSTDDLKEKLLTDDIYIHINSFWHKENLYDSVQKAYEVFDWIKPYEVFRFDTTSKRWIKMINQHIVGKMNIMVLKQTSKKGLSACATAPINRRGLPEKTDSAKKHKSIVQPTPVRSGIQETINTFISIDNYEASKLHLTYRSSPIARRVLATSIIDNYGLGKPVEVDITDKMTNRNIEILQAYLKIMGYDLHQTQDEFYLPDGTDGDSEIKAHQFNGKTYLMTPYEMKRVIAQDIAQREIDRDEYIIVGEDSMPVNQFIDELVDQIEMRIDNEGADYVIQKYSEEE